MTIVANSLEANRLRKQKNHTTIDFLSFSEHYPVMPNGKPRKHYADEITKQSVEADYISGRGSCAQLAKWYGLKPDTVSSWCKRGGWKRATQGAMASVAQRVEQALDKKAETLADRAGLFLERCAKESESWLDTVQTS